MHFYSGVGAIKRTVKKTQGVKKRIMEMWVKICRFLSHSRLFVLEKWQTHTLILNWLLWRCFWVTLLTGKIHSAHVQEAIICFRRKQKYIWLNKCFSRVFSISSILNMQGVSSCNWKNELIYLQKNRAIWRQRIWRT